MWAPVLVGIVNGVEVTVWSPTVTSATSGTPVGRFSRRARPSLALTVVARIGPSAAGPAGGAAAGAAEPEPEPEPERPSAEPEPAPAPASGAAAAARTTTVVSGSATRFWAPRRASCARSVPVTAVPSWPSGRVSIETSLGGSGTAFADATTWADEVSNSSTMPPASGTPAIDATTWPVGQVELRLELGQVVGRRLLRLALLRRQHHADAVGGAHLDCGIDAARSTVSPRGSAAIT